jgi:hypothetical protein
MLVTMLFRGWFCRKQVQICPTGEVVKNEDVMVHSRKDASDPLNGAAAMALEAVMYMLRVRRAESLSESL